MSMYKNKIQSLTTSWTIALLKDVIIYIYINLNTECI